MSSVVEITRTVLDIAAASASAEDKAKLYEASNELNRLLNENKRLKRKNRKLKKKLQRRKDLEFHDGGYYVTGSDGREEGPICPECYESKGFIYPLESTSRGAYCATCEKRFAGADAKIKFRDGMVG